MVLRLSTILALLVFCSSAIAQETSGALADIAQKSAQVRGFRATVETRDRRGMVEAISTSSIVTSRDLGWKMADLTSTGGQIIVCDYRTSYQYLPAERQVLKYTADSPQAMESFRKPASEMNIVSVLDPKSVKVLGEEDFAGEPTYHIEGTTTTQFLPQGKPMTRKIEAWISKNDGLPRKMIEYTELTVGTTIYHNMQINPPLAAKDFEFAPPKGVEVIDMNKEMRKQQQVEQSTKRRR